MNEISTFIPNFFSSSRVEEDKGSILEQVGHSLVSRASRLQLVPRMSLFIVTLLASVRMILIGKEK